MKFLNPDYYVRSFKSLQPVKLKKAGIRLLFCDIDNTLAVLGQEGCSEDNAAFLERMKRCGIEVVLMTNNTKKHTEQVLGGRPDCQVETFCLKPSPTRLWMELSRRNLKPSQAAILGDQLFTDMLAGRLAGVMTVLTAPLSEKERSDTKVMRFFENFVYEKLEKEGQMKRGMFHD